MRLPIFLDTDPGIDDAVAIAAAIFAPELDLQLMTTVAGNVSVEKTTRNALQLLHFWNAEIPLAQGAAVPLVRAPRDAASVHGKSGMAGYDFVEHNRKPLEVPAFLAIRDALMRAPEPVTLVAIGPLTNIALLLSQCPECKPHIRRLVIMGGSAGRGNCTPNAEFNIAADPEAAACVFRSGIEIVMCGLDVTNQAILTPDYLATLPELNRTGKMLPIVKEAFEKYADGETVAEICRQFNARGYKTSKGTAFGKSSFTKIFRNERYIGVYTFHDYRAEDAIPAIIDKDLWDRVQLRVGKIKNAPARNKAKVVYLLSGKIFCGHCGSKMNGNCNAGNYCYYQCYGKKNGNVDCKKKNIRKEFIERLVAQDALSLLTDEYIEQIATIACEKNQHEIELDSALPTIRDRIHQVDLSLNHLLKAIESGSAPDMLVKRMGELEKEKKDLQAQAKKESEDIVELDKAQVIYWLEQFRGGSIEDEEFCRMLIDLFVNSVTVWDEDDNTYKVTVAYNLTSLPTKTYRLNKGGTLSDFASNAPDRKSQDNSIIFFNMSICICDLWTDLLIAHLHAASGFLIHPVQIVICI